MNCLLIYVLYFLNYVSSKFVKFRKPISKVIKHKMQHNFFSNNANRLEIDDKLRPFR